MVGCAGFMLPNELAIFEEMVVRCAGFMLPNELAIFEGMKTTYNTYFVPLVWSASIVMRARKEGRIKDDFAVKTLIDVSDLPVHPSITAL